MSRQEQRFLEVIASSISDASYLGDDATWLDPPGILACADALVEGVHFPASMAPADIGWRTYAVNASDIAAMGGQVAHMLVTASLPKVCDESWIAEFCRGLAQGEARLVGGDLTGADKVYVSATLLGRPHATGIAWRSNCQPGHKIIVSGPVGQARAGLWAWQSQVQSHFPESVAALRRPQPALRQAQDLMDWAAGRPVGMMDASDGLLDCLRQLSRRSRVDMVIDMEALPEAGDEFGDACREAGADPLAWQLIGGDDYVLVACAEAIPSQGWWHIGEVTEGRGEVRIKRGKVTVDVEEYEIFRHF